MNRMSYLGELEQMVLLAVLRIGPESTAGAVREELAAQTGRHVARGAVYITLDRLVNKGYLDSHLVSAAPERRGRPARLFDLREEGRAALRTSRDALVNLWSGVESALDES